MSPTSLLENLKEPVSGVENLNKELQQQLIERAIELESINKNISDYKAAIDESSIVSITNKEGLIQLVNDNFCKISKFSREELIGNSHKLLNSGYHSKEFIRELWLTISSGHIWKGEIKNKAKDGDVYWVDTSIVPFLNDEGNPYKYLSIQSDITKRKQDQEKLISSEERFRNLYENSVVAIVFSAPKSLKLVDANKICLKLFGYHSKKAFLNNYDPSFHWVDVSLREKIIDIIKSKGEVRINALEMRKLNGTLFWANIYTKLDFATGYSQTVIIDITEQVKAHKALTINKDKYQNLFENSLVAIFTFDTQTSKIIEVNKVGVSLMGYQSKKDFIANYSSSSHWIDMFARANIVDNLKNSDGIKTFIHQVMRLDGTVFWARIHLKYNFKTFILHSVIIDVSEQMSSREELENKIKERTIELTNSLLREKELHEMKSSFVSMASHEFRTPLATVLSSASLIAMYKDADQQDKRLKHINRISSSVRNLSHILDNFLSVGELDLGISNIDKTNINLPEFLHLIVDEMSVILEEKNQQIIYHHVGGLMIEQSDKTLKNIIFNLLSNASKYSPTNDKIFLFSNVSNKKATILIQDHGIGIPKKDQKELFNQFFRASNKGNVQGTGLGLYIVKKYLELIGGEISFKSILNEGTTFKITFPLFITQKK